MDGLKNWHDDFGSTLVRKTRETRDLELEENHQFDLHRQAMDALKKDYEARLAQLDTLCTAELQTADDRYQQLLGGAQAQGFRLGAPVSSALGARAASPEALDALKDWLKRKMPEATKELVNHGLAGTSLPPSYGDGDALDRVMTLWAGIVFPYLTPVNGVISRKGREVLAAILAAAPSGRAVHEAYEHNLAVWRESDEGKEIIEGYEAEPEDAFGQIDIRNFLIGRFDDESTDPFLCLYRTINAA